MHDLTAPQAEALIATLLAQPETVRFESKRVSGKMVGKALETICAFANTAGGTLALGLDDLANASTIARNPKNANYGGRCAAYHRWQPLGPVGHFIRTPRA